MNKKEKHKKLVSEKHVSLLVLVSIAAIVLGLYAAVFSSGKPIVNKQAYLVPSPMPTLIPRPTLTPTPTVIPTPVYTGYCVTVPVLLYHHIQPFSAATEKKQTALSVDNGVFQQQMAYLQSHGYTTITASQLVDALRTKSGLPNKSIVVTLDDGYKDAYVYAYPILQQYGITASIFLASGLTEGEDYLNWSQVVEMKNSGKIYFVNHTWSHFALARGDSAKITYEVDTAKQQIEAHTGQTVNIFGYPYGSFNDLAISILQQKGYIGAFSTIPGWVQCDSFIMTLHRNRVGNSPLSAYGL